MRRGVYRGGSGRNLRPVWLKGGEEFHPQAPARTPLEDLKRSPLPRPLADFRGPLRGRGKGKEGKEGGGKVEKGYW